MKTRIFQILIFDHPLNCEPFIVSWRRDERDASRVDCHYYLYTAHNITRLLRASVDTKARIASEALCISIYPQEARS